MYARDFANANYGARNVLEPTSLPGSNIYLIRQTGAYCFRPAYVNGMNVANNYRQFGRLPQAYLCEYGLIAGTLYDIPIDTGVTAKFTRLGEKEYGYTNLMVRAD